MGCQLFNNIRAKNSGEGEIVTFEQIWGKM